MFVTPRFVRDDLLRAQRERGGELGGQRPSLVERIRVQRLRAAQHRRERLQGGADDIVVRLLRGERAAGGLRVETQSPGACVLRSEALAHRLVPDAARGAIFGDFLEEIAVRVEEERKARREIVHVQAAAKPHSTYSMPSRSVNASS